MKTIVIGILFFLSFGIYFICRKKIPSWIAKTKWPDFWIALALPFSYLCVVFLLQILWTWSIVEAWISHFPIAEALNEHSSSFFSIIRAILFYWFLYRFIRKVEESQLKRKKDKNAVLLVFQLIKTCLFCLIALFAAKQIGVSGSGLIALGGTGGVIAGFAARDLLGNFLGGLILYIEKPFRVGDWIRSPDREIEGTVTRIGWRSTEILRFDKRPLYVPNSMFNQISLENPSRMSHRRIYETIGLRYKDFDKIETIIKEVRQYLEANENIDSQETLMVNFDCYDSSSLNLFVYTFTPIKVWAEFHNFKQQVLLDIGLIISNNGAEIAYPTRTLHLEAKE